MRLWHKGKLVFFDKAESKIRDTDRLFEMLHREAEEHGHNLFILDNLMSLLDSTQVEQNAKQGEFLENCSDLARNYDCHVIIVMHTNKVIEIWLEASKEVYIKAITAKLNKFSRDFQSDDDKLLIGLFCALEPVIRGKPKSNAVKIVADVYVKN